MITRYILIARNATTAEYWQFQISTPKSIPALVVNMADPDPASMLEGFSWTPGDALCYSGATTDRRVRAKLLDAGTPQELIR